MTQSTGVAVNGRFMLHRLTGVQRYAREIANRLTPPADVIVPKKYAHGIKGHLWEQAYLPKLVGKRVLWSPGNTGPLAVRRQVVTIHDTMFVDIPGTYNWKFAAWYCWLVPRLVKRIAAVVTVSEYSRRRLIELYNLDPQKVSVVPNGVEGFSPATDERVAAVRKELNLPEQYLFYVGSLKPNKNLPRLLEAWGRLKLWESGIQLAIGGATGATFSQSGIDKVPEGVRFLGYVSEEALPALYTGAMAFVFPSLYEGFGIPAIEAMACNTAVVTSNTTSLPEVVGDAAVLVDPANVDSIADGVERVVSDNALRQQLRDRGRQRAAMYTWQHASELLGGILTRVSANGA